MRIFQFKWFYQETNDKNQIKWDPDMIKSHQGEFWKPQNMRNLMNNNIFLLRLKIWWKCSEKVQFFSFILIKILLISLFLTSESRRVFGVLQWLLVTVSVRYQNRPCLGREWVIDHQYLRRFRCNNRVLHNNAFYGKRCIIFVHLS